MNLKRILSLLLALMMALTVSAVFAEETEADWSMAEYAAHADIRESLASSYEGKTVILHTNDIHGQIDGYALIAGLRDLFVTRGAEVILADAGDFAQGSVYVISTKGAAAVEMMNAVGYDVVAPGNHEFDFGYEKLTENLKNATFQMICSGITLDETGETVYPPSAVIETTGGLKLGFVGVETPETVTKVHPGMISMLSFASFENLYKTAQDAVDGIRDQVDILFGLCHLGVDAESKLNNYRSIDLLERTTGFDFIIDGHSHYVMTSGQHGEPIQSTGTKFENIGVIVIDNETKAIESNFLVPTHLGSELYAPTFVNQDVKAKADKIMADVDAEYNAVFATSEVDLNGSKAPGNRTEETNMGDLITDAMVWSVLKEGGIEQVEPNAVVGITNGGGIRAPIGTGEVSKKDINLVLPFGNTVAVVYVTGAELLEALEASTFCTPDSIGGYPQTSGIEWTLDTTKPFEKGDVYVLDGKESSYFAPASINRVTITAINGEPFDVNATYAVVTNNFCADGGDTYNVFVRSSSSFDTSIPLDEAVMAYVTEALNGVITAEAYGEPRGSVTIIK